MTRFTVLSANCERGSSLVSVLMALGIGAVLSVGVATVFGNVARASKHIELRSDLDELRRTIRDGMSCPRTALQCTGPTGDVAILRTNGSRLIAAAPSTTGTRIGDWNVRTHCTGQGTFTIERARISRVGAAFAEDPLDGSSTGWAELFGPQFPAPCAAFGAAGNWTACPLANSILVGINSDGSPVCRTFAAAAPGQVLTGFNQTGDPVYKTPAVIMACAAQDSGPYDHCICPTGQVLRAWNADLPIPAGMLFHGTCDCCNLTVQLN